VIDKIVAGLDEQIARFQGQVANLQAARKLVLLGDGMPHIHHIGKVPLVTIDPVKRGPYKKNHSPAYLAGRLAAGKKAAKTRAANKAAALKPKRTMSAESRKNMSVARNKVIARKKKEAKAAAAA
jgi:hypothetical protein